MPKKIVKTVVVAEKKVRPRRRNKEFSQVVRKRTEFVRGPQNYRKKKYPGKPQVNYREATRTMKNAFTNKSSGKRPEIIAAMHQTVLPYESPLYRVRSGGNSINETALAKNFTSVSFTTSAIITANPAGRPLLEDGTNIWNLAENAVDVINFYDPYVLGVYPSVAKAGGTVYGSATMINPNFDGTTGIMTFTRSPLASPTIPRTLLEFIELIPLGAGVDSYGPYLPLFTTSMGRAIWIDASGTNPASLTVSLVMDANTSTGQNAFMLSLVPFVKGADSVMSSAPRYQVAFSAVGINQTSTAVISVKASGFYLICVEGVLTVNAGLVPRASPSLTVSTLCSVVSRYIINTNLHATAFSTTATNLPLPREVQVLGASALVSNITAPVYADGAVYANLWDNTSTWYEYTSRSQDTFNSLNAKDMYIGKWIDGVYSWIKPARLEFRETVSRSVNGFYYNTTSIVDPTGDEDSRILGMNVVRIVADVVANVPASKVLLRYCTAFEFTTTSQLFALNNATIHPNVTEEAYFELASLPCFSENGIHDSAFGRAIAKAGNFIWDGLKTVGPYAGLAGGLLSMFPPTRTLGPILSSIAAVSNIDPTKAANQLEKFESAI